MRKSIRTALVAAIERDVTFMVERDWNLELRRTLELAGYLSNFSTHTSKDLGNAIVALLPIVRDEDLIQAAHGAAFYRARRRASWERADAIADKVLSDAGIDVALYNRRLEARAA